MSGYNIDQPRGVDGRWTNSKSSAGPNKGVIIASVLIAAPLPFISTPMVLPVLVGARAFRGRGKNA